MRTKELLQLIPVRLDITKAGNGSKVLKLVGILILQFSPYPRLTISIVLRRTVIKGLRT
jgi:hypothetical protein